MKKDIRRIIEEYTGKIKMFSPVQLEDTIKLHEKSYRLLTWDNAALKRNTMKFNVLHEAMSAAEAAKEWSGRHYETIPLNARPSKSKIPAFANLFAFYLATSFELEKSPGTRLESLHRFFRPNTHPPHNLQARPPSGRQ